MIPEIICFENQTYIKTTNKPSHLSCARGKNYIKTCKLQQVTHMQQVRNLSPPENVKVDGAFYLQQMLPSVLSYMWCSTRASCFSIQSRKVSICLDKLVKYNLFCFFRITALPSVLCYCCRVPMLCRVFFTRYLADLRHHRISAVYRVFFYMALSKNVVD